MSGLPQAYASCPFGVWYSRFASRRATSDDSSLSNRNNSASLERSLSIEEANQLLKRLDESTNRNPGPKRNLEPGFLRWTLGERADLARYRCRMIAGNP
jgi:hypothetical protein